MANRWAHPRSRGEHASNTATSSTSRGSSPLTRGAPTAGGRREAVRGLIPAHAGSTGSTGTTIPPVGAHPRSRGEHVLKHSVHLVHSGSSSLTRGARGSQRNASPRAGLIPAHAGSTVVVLHPAQGERAHPRSRGEHLTDGGTANTMEGSSPLTRGALHNRNRTAHSSRLIPAHAGSTPGSSPGRLGGGLIPAHAGSTALLAAIFASPAAHPRSRGEHQTAGWSLSSLPGSSPLTRGAPPASSASQLR